MARDIEEMRQFWAETNEKLLGAGHLGIKRFFALDHEAYLDGALPAKTKEMLGLCASLVLRCDDCVGYHIDQCLGAGVTRDELLEVFGVALVVGGSIVIPHLRRAFGHMEQSSGTV